MRIATWNVNAINPRLAHLLGWLSAAAPDVVCLQETKCSAQEFPADALAELGYHAAHLGDGRWNGVAILSKHPVTDIATHLPGQPDFEGKAEPRAIGATTAGLRVWSLYVPNGREVAHPHYRYKLAWLDALAANAAAELRNHPDRLLLLGDFNIAPTDADVWDRAAFDGCTHVTAAERDRLAALERTGLREIPPRPLKYDVAFTFWDYRQLAFPKNRGMRIDLAYAPPALLDRVADAYVDREARKGKGTSDHAPIVIDLLGEDA